MNTHLIEPKEIEVDGKEYIISKFPAIEGREIIAMYPLSGLPKIGDYQKNQEVMLKLMSYVAVKVGEIIMPLNNNKLVNSHVKSWETLGKLEIKMMEYNCSFFQVGRISTFLDGFAQKLPAWISRILTDSLGQLLQQEKPPSTN